MIPAAKLRILTPLMAIALAVFVTGPQGAVAQDAGNPSKKVAPEQAKPRDAKPGEIPAIVFGEPVYDFGRVRSGEKITHEFVFNNTGNGPLEILRVKPG